MQCNYDKINETIIVFQVYKMSDPWDVSVVWACMICRETDSDTAHDLFAQFLENGAYRLLDKQLNLYFKCDHCGDLHCGAGLEGEKSRKVVSNKVLAPQSMNHCGN